MSTKIPGTLLDWFLVGLGFGTGMAFTTWALAAAGRLLGL